MKRIITATVLTILIGIYIIIGNYNINKMCKKTEAMINDCRESFETDKESAVKKSEKFITEWDKFHGRLAIFTNHSLLDGISSEVTALPSYVKYGEESDFYACIAKIERFLEQITDEERISIESFY